jgi:hypothetical protein
MLVVQIILVLANVAYSLFAIAELADKSSSSFVLLGRRLPKRAILLVHFLLVVAGVAAVSEV